MLTRENKKEWVREYNLQETIVKHIISSFIQSVYAFGTCFMLKEAEKYFE